ncbi:winged helix-turn-helix domain-containing protein [Streptomyces sp. NPDC046985]|uniref:winged helix-turn-helix domain-containing protein n=1 Tax=Streptomyces sp. NPDC046985 TaxID=3155377 RepID=UPI0033F66ADF
MATTRSLTTAALPAGPHASAPSSASAPAAPAVSAASGPSAAAPRHRLRAVDRDEVVDVREAAASLADLLPPGATWFPAPPHTLPALPGRPPMVGYLVLVPADRQPPFPPVAVPGHARGAALPDGRAAAAAYDTRPDDDSARAADEARGPHEGADPLVRIDAERRTAEVDGRQLDLTYLEFELLAHLVAHPHRVHTRDHLVTSVWGYGHVGDGRTVDVHVARLRRKLGADHRTAIQTVRRVGYKYAPPTAR